MADNATNNNIFFKEFYYICIKNSVEFDYNQNYVWCLAHIINLVVQEILKHMKANNIKDENVILRDEYNVNSVIFKVRIK